MKKEQKEICKVRKQTGLTCKGCVFEDKCVPKATKKKKVKPQSKTDIAIKAYQRGMSTDEIVNYYGFSRSLLSWVRLNHPEEVKNDS